MKGRRVVQADQLAQFRKPDSLAMARHFFEDREGATERLNAAGALLVVGVIVAIDFGSRDQLGYCGLARACGLFACAGLGTRSQGHGPLWQFRRDSMLR